MILLFISSGSKSRLDISSSTFPSLVVALPVNNIASAKEVLPEPPCPIRPTFLNSSAFLSMFKSFRDHYEGYIHKQISDFGFLPEQELTSDRADYWEF